jgi:hypothetical protein
MKTDARSSYISIFTDITRKNHQRLIELEAQENAIKKKQNDVRSDAHQVEHELVSLQEKIFESAINVIVFSAMTLEAYVYDYASRNLTDSFVQDHLDKLDLVSKWVVIPRLLTGKELPRDHRWFTKLKRLIQQRNALIHHKSSSPPPLLEDAISYLENMSKRDEKLLNTAREALELLDLLPDEIKKLDPDEYIWAQSYLIAKSDNHFTFLEEP